MDNIETKDGVFEFFGDGVSYNTNWKKEEILGLGAFGSVYRATKITAKGVMVFAVKEIKIPSKMYDQYVQETVKKEIIALRQLTHASIVEYYGDCCSNKLVHYIFLEYMPYGTLNDFIVKNKIQEELARFLSKQIIEGVDYLHGRRLFHRDIKSANCLMRNSYIVKLADFGLTRKYLDFTQSYTKETLGTLRFMAPEMLHSNRYNKYVDIWSVGCVVLHMLTGNEPFHEIDEQQQVMYRISQDPSPISGLTLKVSTSAKQFLEQIFQIDPRKRPDTDVLLTHEFITDAQYFPNWKKEVILSLDDYGSVFRTTKRTSRGALELVCKEVNFPERNSQRNKDIIMKEINVLRQLSHKRIITYLGVNFFIHNTSHYIFNEFMPAGSLRDFIIAQKLATVGNARNLARQILEGVQYLHRNCLSNRNIKSSNILMQDDYNVKLANYSLTREYQEIVRPHKMESLETIRFMAPESLTSINYNKYTDIWSVGCVVLHMLSGKEPFYELQEPQEIKRALYYNQSPIAGISFALLKSAENFFQNTFQVVPERRHDANFLLKDAFIIGLQDEHSVKLANLGLTRENQELMQSYSNESLQTNSHGPRKLLLIGRFGNELQSSVKSIVRVDSSSDRIMAVKCPGVGYTGCDLMEPIQSVIDCVKCKILRYEEFNAIVFVMKYGVRFSKKDKDSVDVVKTIFGEDMFRKYGVILMTYGELFDMKYYDGGMFEEWCKLQTGDMQRLFQEVNYRIVLFDNKTNDCSKLEEQFNILRAVVLNLNAVYDMNTFERARLIEEFFRRVIANLKLRLS